MSKKKQPVEEEYSAKNIQKLDPREHIRRRPGMYIGGTDKRGLHHLVYEVLDHSAESAFVGACNMITIRLQSDNFVTITDNDRTLSDHILKSPFDKTHNIHTLDVIMTKVGAWQKFKNEAYGATGGLHGLGLSVVTPLCATMQVAVCRDNQVWKRFYREGKPVGALQTYQSVVDIEDGVAFTFQPDYSIFEHNQFEYERIAIRCEDIAYNTANLTIHLIDERVNPPMQETFYSSDGIKSLVKKLNVNKTPLHEIIHITGEIDTQVSGKIKPFYVEIAMQYTDSDETIERNYVNTVANIQGGVHISGLYAGIVGIVNNHFQFMYDPPRYLSWEQIRQGLTVVISIRHPDVQFQSPTKTHLMNPEIFGGVANLVYMSTHHQITRELQYHFQSMYEVFDT